jgi:hypothetical protein
MFLTQEKVSQQLLLLLNQASLYDESANIKLLKVSTYCQYNRDNY